MLGKSYIIDHCHAYCVKRTESEVLRTYVTDALKAIAHNTAGLREDNLTLRMRYDDVIKNSKPTTEDEPESADKVITHFRDKMRNFEQKGDEPDGLDDTGRKADA